MADTNRSSNGQSAVVELSIDIEAGAGTVWYLLSTPAGFSALMQGQVTFETAPGSAFRAEFPSGRLSAAKSSAATRMAGGWR